MNNIAVSMTHKAYKNYLTPVKLGGCGFKDKKGLINYLNNTGSYLGIVSDIIVEREDIKTNYTDKVASDILYQ